MKCPSCAYKETKVVDSRLSGDGNSIRRRRECLKCEHRFTTYEYVEQVPLMVVKRDGRRQPFDRKRIIAGLVKACEKRPVSMDTMEEVTAAIAALPQEALVSSSFHGTRVLSLYSTTSTGGSLWAGHLD